MLNTSALLNRKEKEHIEFPFLSKLPAILSFYTLIKFLQYNSNKTSIKPTLIN